jgi:hypothetical protein
MHSETVRGPHSLGSENYDARQYCSGFRRDLHSPIWPLAAIRIGFLTGIDEMTGSGHQDSVQRCKSG